MAAWRHNRGTGEGAPGGGPRDDLAVLRHAPEPLNWRRGVLVGASMIAALILLAAIAVLVVTGTDWGHERVRRYAQGMINGMIHGKATIGLLSGNLLTGMTVHDLAITDSTGQAFIAVESFRANYEVASLLRKR